MLQNAQSLPADSVCTSLEPIQHLSTYSVPSDCQRAWFKEGKDACRNVLASCEMLRDPLVQEMVERWGPSPNLIHEICSSEWSGGKPSAFYFVECFEEERQPEIWGELVKASNPCARDAGNSFLNNPCIHKASKESITTTSTTAMVNSTTEESYRSTSRKAVTTASTTTDSYTADTTAKIIEAMGSLSNTTEGSHSPTPGKATSGATGGSGFTLRQSIMTSALIACVGLYATASSHYTDF